MPAETQRMLQLVAIAGQPLREHDLFSIAGTGCDDLARLNQLRANHLVRSVGEGISSLVDTYHDRVREAVLAHTTPEHGQELHLQLAQTLEAAGDRDFESLARHFLAAGRHVQARDYYAMAANRAAASLAFDQTVKLYQQALSLCDMKDPDRPKWMACLGDALVNAGRGVEAGIAYVAAADSSEGLERLELRRRAFIQYLLNGDFDQGMTILSSVLKEVGIRFPRSRMLSLLSFVLTDVRLRLPGTKGRAVWSTHSC